MDQTIMMGMEKDRNYFQVLEFIYKRQILFFCTQRGLSANEALPSCVRMNFIDSAEDFLN